MALRSSLCEQENWERRAGLAAPQVTRPASLQMSSQTSSEATEVILLLFPPSPQIHESALRAKNRRQVEKRRLVAQRQRAHSAEAEKGRRLRPGPAESPWVTEYMRCYSARA